MRQWTLFGALVAVVAFACAGEQTLVNDSGLPADGVHVEFSRPVEITAVDPLFPHYNQGEAARNVWFFGWKLLPKNEITIDWEPSNAEIVGAYWLPWQAAILVEPPGLVDAFEDGDLTSVLGAEWMTSPCSEGLEIGTLLVVDNEDNAALELEIGGAGTASLTLDFAPHDVSAYEGILVRASASAPFTLAIELMARDPACQTGHRFVNCLEPAGVAGAMTEVRFPFASFTCEPGNCPADDESRLTGRLIHIGIFATASAESTLRIAEVSFYSSDVP